MYHFVIEDEKKRVLMVLFEKKCNLTQIFFENLCVSKTAMSLKSFIKTALISIILFFSLVFLGMKYHWIGFFQTGNNQDMTLSIPDLPVSPELANNGVEEEKIEGDFQPEIIPTLSSDSLIENMTKNQVEENCLQLYQEETDELLLELAVGNCVLSNFNDPYQELSEERGTASNNRQKQTHKKNIINTCSQKVDEMSYNNEIERQLLIGICLSNF